MAISIRQYERWLQDNYADLERKKVWLSHVLLTVLLLLFIVYSFDVGGMVVGIVVQIIEIILFGVMLWRVETMPSLEDVSTEQADSLSAAETLPESSDLSEAEQTSAALSNM